MKKLKPYKVTKDNGYWVVIDKESHVYTMGKTKAELNKNYVIALRLMLRSFIKEHCPGIGKDAVMSYKQPKNWGLNRPAKKPGKH